MDQKEKATFEGVEIEWVSRWGKNGKFYQWHITTQKQLDDLIAKYGIEEINEEDKSMWLEW